MELENPLEITEVRSGPCQADVCLSCFSKNFNEAAHYQWVGVFLWSKCRTESFP